MGHAYDDRLRPLSQGGAGWGFFSFMKRRIFRLHPMVVFGTLLGTVLFYFGASPVFPLIAECPLWKLLLYALLSMLIIPTTKTMDIRGSYPETYNLDGPIWSLSWEYLANILYVLFIRKFSKLALGALVAVGACSTAYLAIGQGDVCGGWYLDGEHIYIGLTRLVFPFFGGLLLYRIGKFIKVKNAFFWCSFILVALFSVPRIGTAETVWQNGIYELAVIYFSFPLVVAMGAGGSLKSAVSQRLCRFLGDISYPVYLINYPVCYVLKGWVSRVREGNPDFSFADNPAIPLLVFVGIVVFSHLVSRFYDIPLRKWLKTKL
jgi:peptidoglycan/LPS O-acetylase OafA/YrhL